MRTLYLYRAYVARSLEEAGVPALDEEHLDAPHNEVYRPLFAAEVLRTGSCRRDRINFYSLPAEPAMVG